MRPWAAVALVLALVAPVAPGNAFGDELPMDVDKDGVVDADDDCPDSAPYAMVDAAGCDVCACDDAWESRAEYLRCIFGELHARRRDGRLGRKAARVVLKAVRSSTCGYETKVRCCIAFPGRPKAMCKVVDELRCEAMSLGAATVVDHDTGSCFPNPCDAD